MATGEETVSVQSLEPDFSNPKAQARNLPRAAVVVASK